MLRKKEKRIIEKNQKISMKKEYLFKKFIYIIFIKTN